MCLKCGPNPEMHASRFGLFRFRSPLLSESLFIFSSSGYLDVSVHRVPSANLWIQLTVHEVFSCGFPHSDICGSMLICSSPQLFAAYHVFRRLLVPRHPPCALLCLFSKATLHIALCKDFLNVNRLNIGFSRMSCIYFSQKIYLRLIDSLFGFQGTNNIYIK